VLQVKALAEGVVILKSTLGGRAHAVAFHDWLHRFNTKDVCCQPNQPKR
jgi:hypothetical protein